MSPCPDPALLGAYAEGGLSGPPLDGLEGHLASCPSCRRQALVLAEAVSRPSPSLSLRWWPAAAAVLLAVSLWSMRSLLLPSSPAPEAGSPRPAPPPRPAEAPRSWSLGGRLLALDAGGEVEEIAGALSLSRGALWVEGGLEAAALRILTPLGELDAGSGECLVRLEEDGPRAAALSRLLLRSAQAAGPSRLTVACLTGAAVFRSGGSEWALEAGSLLEVVPGAAPLRRALEDREASGLSAWMAPLRRTRAFPGRALSSGRMALPIPASGDWTLEVTLKPLGSGGGDLGVAFPVPGAFSCWVAPLAALHPEGSLLEVRCRGGELAFRLDGRLVSRMSVAALRSAAPAPEGAGILVWGGAVQVSGTRLTAWWGAEGP